MAPTSSRQWSHAPAHLLETLEPRCLLAAWLVQPYGFDAPPDVSGPRVVAASDDGVYLVRSTAVSTGSPAVVLFGDEAVEADDYAPMRADEVRAITRGGTILGNFRGRDVHGAFIHPRGAEGFISIADLVGEVQGGRTPDYADMTALDITERGHIVLAERLNVEQVQIWVLVPVDPDGVVGAQGDGILIPLWTTTPDGSRADANSSGVVVGEQRTGPSPTQRQAMMWQRETGITPIEGLASAGAVNEDGTVVGLVLRDGAPTPAVAVGAAVVDLGLPVEYVRGEDSGAWFVGAVGAGGTATFTFRERFRLPGDHSPQFRSESYIRLDGDVTGMPIRDVVFGISDSREDFQSVWTGAPVAILAGGDMVFADAVLRPIADDIPFRLIGGRPTTTITDALGTVVAGIGPFGDLIALRQEAGEWRPIRISDGSLLGDDIELGSFVDRHSGLARIVVAGARMSALSGKEMRIYTVGRTVAPTVPQLTPGGLPGSSVDRGLTVFTLADGRPAIAGLRDEGSAVMWWEDAANQNGSVDVSIGVWEFANLSRAHIEAGRGLVAPVFASNLVGFATAWGGMNIAGIDENGRLQALWWAPGIGDYWTVSDLSESAGAPVLSGNLSGFVSSWNGMQYTAADAEGSTLAVWWAPGMESWAATDLTAAIPGAPRLDAATAVSLITPWGAQHIFGTDAASGAAVVYWWAPGMDAWAAATLDVAAGREVSTGGRPLSAHVSPAGEIRVGGFRDAGADDAPLLLAWSPSSPQWALEDLLAAAFVQG